MNAKPASPHGPLLVTEQARRMLEPAQSTVRQLGFDPIATATTLALAGSSVFLSTGAQAGSSLQARLQQLETAAQGRLGVTILDTATGAVRAVNGGAAEAAVDAEWLAERTPFKKG